jgi:hypothetical protein
VNGVELTKAAIAREVTEVSDKSRAVVEKL